jgi:hypothetical protein
LKGFTRVFRVNPRQRLFRKGKSFVSTRINADETRIKRFSFERLYPRLPHESAAKAFRKGKSFVSTRIGADETRIKRFSA